MLVKVLRDEGRKRRHEDGDVQQYMVQHLQSRLGFSVASLQSLESIAIQSDIPVGQLRDKPDQRWHDRVQAVGGHFLVHEFNEALRRSGNPHVGRIFRRLHHFHGGDKVGSLIGFPPFHILDKETKGVVQRQEHLLHHSQHARLLKLETFRPHHGRVDEVHPQCIRAVLGNDDVRVGIVLETLRHLLAVARQHQAVHNQILERRLVEQRRTQHHQRVEPPARLVESLGDEVRGKSALELLLVLERVMLRRVGHRTRFEPAIEHLVDASQDRPRILLRRDGDLVDHVLVQVRHADAAQLEQLLHASDADHLFHVLAAPDGNGRAPESIATDGPIPRVHEPAVESSLLDRIRHPVRLLVVLDDLIANVFHLDEPRRHRLVDEGRVAAPAEGIAVIEVVLVDQPAALLDEFDERVVGLLDVQPLHLGDVGGEESVGVDGTREVLPLLDDAVREAHAVIVLAEGGRLVDDARSGVVGDVLVREDAKVLLGPLAGGEVVEDGLVLLADEVASKVGGLDGVQIVCHLGLPLLLVVHDGEQLGQTRLGEYVPLFGLLVEDLDVFHGGMNAQRDVAGQSPGSRRPRHEARALVVLHREAHHHGRIANVLVIQPRLEVAQRRPARGAEGHDLVPLVHQILPKQLLEHPPHALHERGVHRLVIVLEVDPPSESRDGLLPLLGVPRDDAAAGVVVLVDAHLEDLIAVGDVELLVDLVLDGEAVAVPSRAAGDVVSGLAGVAGDDVLDGSGEDVSVVGEAGGEGRSVVEGELLIASIDAQRILFLERFLFRPFGTNFFLGFCKVECSWKVRHGVVFLFVCIFV
mmetsp:Transcript_6466/g.14027  ORF Transcript_6466/g.14027 Transcript_6466/m.14027 type:complete len:811 (-) Transcript_6466:137-2569(-)